MKSLFMLGTRSIQFLYPSSLLLVQVLDVQPPSVACLLEGTRVCAYWSQQLTCLYPGTISNGKI